MSDATTTELEPETIDATEPAEPSPEAPAEDHAAADAAFLAELRTRNAEVEELRRVADDDDSKAKAASKRAKASEDTWREKSRALSQFISGQDESMPLFDRKAEPSANGKADAPADAWKAVPLAELEGIPGGTLEKLTEADPPVLTIDDFRRWQESGQKIRGLGPEKIAKVSDALIGYFEVHPVGEPSVFALPALAKEDDDAMDRDPEDDDPSVYEPDGYK